MILSQTRPVSKQLEQRVVGISVMSKYSYFNLLKAEAKAFAKSNTLPLSAAQEQLASQAGFASFHELTTVAIRNPSDPRLMEAALGTSDLGEVVYEHDIFFELDSLVEDCMSSEIADTNAYAFGIEDLHVLLASYDEQVGVLSLQVSFEYSGEQDQDRTYHGSAFYIDAIVRLCRRNGVWTFSDPDGLEIIRGESDMDRYHREDHADGA